MFHPTRHGELMSVAPVDAPLGYACTGGGRPQGSLSASAMRARTALHLPGEMNEQLGALARREAISVSAIIRREISREISFCAQK
jgi:hypothetical protein